MLKRCFNSIIFLLVIFLQFCSVLKHEVTISEEAFYNFLKLKMRVSGSEFKQKGKILLLFDDSRTKMIFLSPFNQIYFKLYVVNEKALLINTKKKRYWRGEFNLLLKKIWNIDFDYIELKELILTGKIPENKIIRDNLNIEVEKQNNQPQKIAIRGENLLLRFSVLTRKVRPGRIVFNYILEDLEKSKITEVLEE